MGVYNQVPPSGGWAMGQSPILGKKTQITETKSLEENLLLLENVVTCETPDDGYLAWPEHANMKLQGESRKEPLQRMKSFTDPKHTLKIGSWNVRTMYQVGKTKQVVNEMENYKLDILGISELRWTGFGKMKTSDNKIILYSGSEDKHESGVALILNQNANKSLIDWEPVNERIIKARFFSKYIKLSVIQVYAPTNDADEENKHLFYEILQKTLDKVPKHDMTVIIGDFNAKVGHRSSSAERSVGNEASGIRNENGELFVTFCEMNNLLIGGSVFKH